MLFKLYIYLGAFVTYCDPILVSSKFAKYYCFHPTFWLTSLSRSRSRARGGVRKIYKTG